MEPYKQKSPIWANFSLRKKKWKGKKFIAQQGTGSHRPTCLVSLIGLHPTTWRHSSTYGRLEATSPQFVIAWILITPSVWDSQLLPGDRTQYQGPGLTSHSVRSSSAPRDALCLNSSVFWSYHILEHSWASWLQLTFQLEQKMWRMCIKKKKTKSSW